MMNIPCIKFHLEKNRLMLILVENANNLVYNIIFASITKVYCFNV